MLSHFYRAQQQSHTNAHVAAATATANTDPYNLECKTTFRVWPWAMDGGMISMTVSLANCEYRLE